MNKYRLIIGLRQPNRKIRMGDVTEDELAQVSNAMSSQHFTEIHGPTKAGSLIVVPASNIAYLEAIPVGGSDAEES